jgi:hypothetical protein
LIQQGNDTGMVSTTNPAAVLIIRRSFLDGHL